MKQYNKFSKDLLNKLELIFDKNFIFTDNAVLKEYSHDETENLPAGVLLIKRTAFNKAWSKIYRNLTGT